MRKLQLKNQTNFSLSAKWQYAIWDNLCQNWYITLFVYYSQVYLWTYVIWDSANDMGYNKGTI